MRKTVFEQIFDKSVFDALVPQLVHALGNTLILAAISIIFGFLLSFAAALGLRSRYKILSAAAESYVWLFRCTPLLVQALYMYFVVPEIIHVQLSANTSGFIVLSLISGAYMANIISDALDSVDQGQREAGLALGMRPVHVFFFITFAQAFQNMIPALFNQFVICVKDTAVLSVISVNELTHVTKMYASLTYKNLASYTILAIFYWMIINLLFGIQKIIEKRFGSAKTFEQIPQKIKYKKEKKRQRKLMEKKGMVTNE